jgi:putative transposase
MPSVKISKELNEGIYYLTFTVRNWHYIFDRHNRFQILADSLSYCQSHKALKVYAYVFMINHMHLIASAPDMSGFVRDFKKFTSREMRENIMATEPPVLKYFEDRKGGHEFWSATNMPKMIETEAFLIQKMQYVHNNPVRRQYVQRPEDWVWSSANPGSVVKIEPIER